MQAATIDLPNPFILQFGDERHEIKSPSVLEWKLITKTVYFHEPPLDEPVSIVPVRNELRLFIADRLAYKGEGIHELGRLVRPDVGLAEVHLDPRYVHAVI